MELTPKQLQRFLDQHGLSQRGAAALIGIGERTMRRYIAGDLPVPLTVEYALRWVAHEKATVDLGRLRGLLTESERDANRYRWIRSAPESWVREVGSWSPEWLDQEVSKQIAATLESQR